MAVVAPELEWVDGGGWEGLAPVWPFERPRPSGLEAFLDGRRFQLHVEYLQGFPMVAPVIWPLDPEPDPRHRSLHTWHVNPDGSLCLMQSAGDWTGGETASDLVVKASGWFLEYLLMESGAIDEMTLRGVASDASLDPLFRDTSHAS